MNAVFDVKEVFVLNDVVRFACKTFEPGTRIVEVRRDETTITFVAQEFEFTVGIGDRVHRLILKCSQ